MIILSWIWYSWLLTDVIPLISKFGVYGNNIEALTAYTSTRGFNVLCGSDVKDATFEWRFANGSRIGASNPGFRGAHFINGKMWLYIPDYGLIPTHSYGDSSYNMYVYVYIVSIPC